MGKEIISGNAKRLIDGYYKMQTLLFHGNAKKAPKLEDENVEKTIVDYVRQTPNDSTLEMNVSVQCYYGDYSLKHGVKRFTRNFDSVDKLVEEGMDIPEDIVFVRVVGTPIIVHEDGSKQKCDRLDSPAFEDRIWVLDGEGKELEDRIHDLERTTKSSTSSVYKLNVRDDKIFGFKDFKKFCKLLNLVGISQLTSV